MTAKKSRASKKIAKKSSATKSPPKKKAAKKSTAKRPAAKRSASKADHLSRLREICLALPESSEVTAWGSPTFRVKGKIFAMYASANDHHGGGRPGVWIISIPVEQDLILRARPDRYFKPPYVGPNGWIGAWLDANPPWGEIEEIIRDGFRRRAPKKIAALLGD